MQEWAWLNLTVRDVVRIPNWFETTKSSYTRSDPVIMNIMEGSIYCGEGVQTALELCATDLTPRNELNMQWENPRINIYA